MSRRPPPRRNSRGPAPAPAASGHRPLLLAVALAAGFAPLAVRSQAVGGNAIVGTMSVTQQGTTQTVRTTNGAGGFSAINWQSFSVPGGTTTYVAQPNAASLSINRVLGPDPSAIFGTLGSNGRLVLVNPAGITVGAGAVVDTAGFTASTLRMSDADAMAGRLRFDGGAGGLMRVDGKIVARSGDVVLIGQDVQTGPSALVQSPQGSTILAAGQKVEVTGRGLEGIVFAVQAPTDQAVNLGTLQGDAVGVFAGTLKHSGLILAQAVSVEGGRVVLKAADKVLVDGAIQAQGLNGQGGKVDVLGDKVGLLAGASIDTSNSASGGQIRVGGGYQGKDTDVPNAAVTYVDKDATLRANATDAGNGGKLIVWADDTTRAYGSIEAKGGANGGDGGFIETSGKRYLDANGAKVDASAPNGAAGTWLLDPSNISIVATGADSAGGGPTFNPGSANATITAGTLNAAIDANTNVLVSTSSGSGGGGNITFDATAGSILIKRSTGGPSTATFQADNDILFANGTTTFAAGSASSLTAKLQPGAAGNVGIQVGATLAVDGSLGGLAGVEVAPGKVLQNTGSLVLTGGTASVKADTLFTSTSLLANGGSVTVGDFTHSAGSVDFTGNANLTVSTSFASTGGAFEFSGAGKLDITQSSGTLVIPGGSSAFSGDSIKLKANAGNVQLPLRDLVTYGNWSGTPGQGNVEVVASGSITFGTIWTQGGARGGAAVQGGDVTLTAGTGINGSYIHASGVASPDGSFGAAGGNVTVTSSANNISLGNVTSIGSSANGGTPGDGGVVSLTSTGGNLTVGSIDTSGGADISGAAAGGNGQSVTLSATRVLGVGGVISTAAIAAGGGSGGFGGGGGAVAVDGDALVSVGSVTTTTGPSAISLASSAGSVHLRGDAGLDIQAIDTGGSADSLVPPVVDLVSGAGGILQTAGGIRTANLGVRAQGDAILGSLVNSVETVAANVNGDLLVRNGADLVVGSMALPDTTVLSGITARSVSIATAGGMLVSSPIVSTSGDVSLLVNDSSIPPLSVVTPSLQVQANITSAGAITLASDSDPGGTGNVIDVTSSTIAANGGQLSISALGGIQVSDSVLSGMYVQIEKTGAGSGSLSLSNTTVTAAGNPVSWIQVKNYDAADAISLSNVTGSSVGPLIVGADGGAYVTNSTLASSNDNVAVSGEYTARVIGSTLTAGTNGAVYVSGGVGYTGARGTSGLLVRDSTFNAGLQVYLTGESGDASRWGAQMEGTLNFASGGGSFVSGVNTSTDSVAFPAGGLLVTPQQLACDGPCVGPAPVAVLQGTGDLHLQGSAAGPHVGLRIADASILQTGNVVLFGSSGTGLGTIPPTYLPGLEITSSTVQVQGNLFLSSGESIDVSWSSLTADDVFVIGGSSARSSGEGVVLWSSTVNVAAPLGNLQIQGDAEGSYEYGITANASTLTTAGGVVSLSTSKGLVLNGTTVESNGGDIYLSGGWWGLAIPGVQLYGSSVHAGTGNANVYAVADGASGPAFVFASSNPSATLAGTDVVVTASNTTPGFAAISINNESVSALNSITMTATGGGIEVVNGSTFTNTGTGPTQLISDPGSTGTSFVNITAGNAINVGGDFSITANDIQIGSPITAARVVLQAFDASLPITLGDGAASTGTLNFSTTTLSALSTSAIVIGDSSQTGGIDIISNVNVTASPSLSLITDGDIKQEPLTTLSAQKLNADAGKSVLLDSVDLGSTVGLGVLSGRAWGGDFKVKNVGSTKLQIGTVDGVPGIEAYPAVAMPGTGRVVVETAGPVQLSNVMFADAIGGSDALVLAATSLTTDTGALLVGQDRWTVYLQGAPTSALAGSPVSGNDVVWNRAYDGSPLADTGNRYVFDYQPQVTISVAPVTRTYDAGNSFGAMTPLISGVPNAALSGNVFNPDVVNVALDPLVASANVGTYSIGLSGVSQPAGYLPPNYLGGTAQITPATLTISAAGATKVYDGTASSLMAPLFSGTFGTDTVTSLTQAFDSKNAGARTLSVNGGFTVNDGNFGNNYAVVIVNGAGGTISPAPLDVNGLSAVNKQYDATTTANLSGTATLSGVFLSDVVGVASTTAAFADKNVGFGKPVNVSAVTLNGADASNYVWNGALTLSADITPAPVSLVGLVAANKVYDNTTVATLGGGSLSGVLAGDLVTIASLPSAAFADKNVGIGKAVTLSGGVLGSTDGGNYALSALPALSANISPATVNVTGGLTVATRIYDAGTAATLNGPATLSGVFAGDAVVVPGGVGTFATKTAGTNKPVTVTGVTLAGGDAGNYVVGTLPTGLTGNIAPAVLTVGGVTAANKVYDGGTGANFTGTPTLGGVLGGDTVFLSTIGGNFADRNVGAAKPVTVTTATAGGADAGNYVLQVPTGLAATITPAPYTITVNPETRTYNGTDFSFMGVSTTGAVYVGDTLSIQPPTHSTKNAGPTTISTTFSMADGNGGNNYAISVVPTPGSITPAPLTINPVSDSRSYNGTTTSAGVPVASGTMYGTDSYVGGTQAYDIKNAGTRTLSVTSYLISDGNGGNNYAVATGTNTGVINPASLTVGGITAQNKVYDSTTVAGFSGTPTLAGVIGGDTVSVAGSGIGNFSDKNVGSAKPVTLNTASLTLSGTDAGNYVLLPSGGHAASISPATLVVSGLTAADKVYDGSTTALLTGSAGLGGVFAGDTVSLTASPTGTFSNANVGTSKPVTIGGSALLAGADAGNYVVLPPAALSANITPAPLTVAALDQNKAQGSLFTFSGNEVSATGLVGSESVAAASLASTGSAVDVAIGTYPITVGGPLAGSNGFLASNYSVTFKPGTMAVSTVQTAVTQQVDNLVVTFLVKFTQESVTQQSTKDEKDKAKGQPDIVQTDVACKPS